MQSKRVIMLNTDFSILHPSIAKFILDPLISNIFIIRSYWEILLTSCISSFSWRTIRVPLVIGAESSLVTTNEPPAADSQQCCSSSLFLEYTVTYKKRNKIINRRNRKLYSKCNITQVWHCWRSSFMRSITSNKKMVCFGSECVRKRSKLVCFIITAHPRQLFRDN